MFEYFAGSVAVRWQNMEGISDMGRLLLDKIKTFVPTGNIPSIGFPKWRVGLLFNLMRFYMDAQNFWEVIEELCGKKVFVLAFAYPGPDYGYHRNVATLAIQVIDREKEVDLGKISLIIVLPEDDSLIV